MGGTLPAALGARVIASAWDQVVFNDGTSAIGVELEKVAAGWLLDLFDLPREASVGFVTGTTMGALVCLAAARHALLAKAGWDATSKGGKRGRGKRGRRQLNRLRPPWPATCTTSGRTSQRTFHHRLEARISQGTLLHEVLPHRVFVFLGLAPA